MLIFVTQSNLFALPSQERLSVMLFCLVSGLLPDQFSVSDHPPQRRQLWNERHAAFLQAACSFAPLPSRTFRRRAASALVSFTLSVIFFTSLLVIEGGPCSHLRVQARHTYPRFSS